MAVDKQNFIKTQINALLILRFIIAFDELEKAVRNVFSESIGAISPSNREFLYFYYSCLKVNSLQFEFGNSLIRSGNAKYSPSETFSNLSFSHIIKAHRARNLLEAFNFNIVSLNQKGTEYPFTDCCIKLISMRNKIAHESSSLAFGDKETIEIASNGFIVENCSDIIGNLDPELMSDEGKCIFSSIMLIDKIMSRLGKQETIYDKRMDS